MFKIDTKTNSIYLTRGDKATFTLKINDYTFGPGDKVEFRVYPKKGMNTLPLVDVVVNVQEELEKVQIPLTSEMTKIGDIVNKVTTYWYEIELNDKTTVIGYDDDGPKLLYLYPEGEEKPPIEEDKEEDVNE